MMQKSAVKPLRGVALIVVATFFFAATATLGKHLALAYSAPLILAARYVVNLGIVMAIMLPRHGVALWRTNRTGLVVLRGLCLALVTVTMLLALRIMPVAETVAITYVAPILVMLASGTILAERVGPLGWVSAILGFAGVLLVARPGGGLDPLGVGLALGSAVFAATYHLLTRALARTETTMALMAHAALAGTVVFVALVLLMPLPALPGPLDAGLMAALGALATVGHLLFTAAYRDAPAATLAPFTYMHIAFASLLGAMIFGQVPDGYGFAGMAAIAVAGLLSAWRASHQTSDFRSPAQSQPQELAPSARSGRQY